MATAPKNLPIIPSKAPNLPIATVEYSQAYTDQLLNTLRLYFNQIDNFTQPLSTTSGGSYLTFPYGAFHYDKSTALTAAITNTSTTPIAVSSTSGFANSGAIMIGTEIITYTTTTATAFDGTVTRGAYGTTKSAHSIGDVVTSVQGTTANTRTPMYLNTTDFSNTVSLVGSGNTSQISFNVAGVYNIQFSAQAGNAGASPDNVTIWVRQNGADIPETAGIATVPSSHGGIDGAAIFSWNYFISANSGDYVELYWTTDSGTSVIKTYPAGVSPVHPVSPALILTAQFVSAL